MFSSRRIAVAATLLLSSATLTGAPVNGALAASPLKKKPTVAGVKKNAPTRKASPTKPNSRLKEVAQKAAVPRSEFISVNEIKPGMKGYGLTVFKGTKIERFDVTVIDILRNHPYVLGRDLILIRTHGPVFDKRRALGIQGMSGSPIYFNGRLAGAYAWGENSINEPVAMVTPIEYMLEAWSEKLPQKPLYTSVGGGFTPQISSKVAAIFGPDFSSSTGATRTESLPNPAASSSTMNPMIVSTAGLSPHILQQMNQRMSGSGITFQAATAGGRSVQADKAPPLQPGSAFGIAFATGDIQMGGTGTVTYRKGNRVLTLGHYALAFGGFGPIEAPMTTAYVADIMSKMDVSFKMTNMGKTIGTMTQDTPYGTAGVVGRTPDLVNVTVNVVNNATGRTRTIRSSVMKHPLLTANFIRGVASEAIFRMHTFPGDAMAEVDLRINADGMQPIVRKNTFFAPFFIDMFAVQDLDDILAILTRNEFGPVDINHINVDVKISPGRKSMRIERAFVDRDTVEPGETVQVGVVLRPWRKEPFVKTISVKVPESIPNGRTQIVVTNGATPVNIAPSAPTPPPGSTMTPVAAAPATGPMFRNVQQMLDRYLELGSNEELAVRLFLTSPGVNILGERLYDVPDPIGAVLRSPKSSGYRMERDAVKEVVDMDSLITGSAIVPITIQRSSYREQGATTARPAPRTPPAGTSTPSSTPPSSTSVGDTLDETFDAGDAADAVQSALPSEAASPTLRALGIFPAHEGSRTSPPDPRRMNPLPLQRGAGTTPTGEDAALFVELAARPDEATEKKDEEKKPVGSAKVTPAGETSDSTKPEEKKEEKPAADTDDKTKGPGRTATLWTQKSKAQFERGDGTGVGVTTLGDIRLAPTLKRQKLLEQEAQIWSMIADGRGGYLLGTGSSGNIYPMDAAGKIGEPIKTEDLSIRALTRGPDGTVYAGGWPTGTLYKLSGGKAMPFAKTGARYILSLIADGAGNLYAAVGPGGRVLKVTPAGKTSTFFQTSQPHVLSLALDKENHLIVGTSDSGALYRVSPEGRSTVLYDPEDNAVTALLVSKDGEIYAGTSPKGRILNVKPGGVTRITYEAGAPVMALEQDPEGHLYAAAGTGVIHIDPKAEVVTRLDTKDQNQILDLMWTENRGLWAVSGNLAGIYRAEAQRETGEYLSPVHDSKNPSRWGRISWQARIPKGGNVILETRSGNTADPDATWSAWSSAYTDSNGSSVASPRGRFIQYRAHLKAGEEGASPELKSVTVSYLSENRPPSVAFTSPSVADVWSDKQTIRWSASDPDKDTLTYELFYSPDGVNSWKPIKSGATKSGTNTAATTAKPEVKSTAQEQRESPSTPESRELMNKLQTELDKDSTISQEDRALLDAILPEVVKDAAANPSSKVIKPDPAPAGAVAEKPLSETSYSWDTKEIPDGEYFLKIVATDKRSNPSDPQTDEKVLGPVTILNQKPKVEIAESLAEVRDRAVTVQGLADGGKAPIATVSYRIDKGEWSAAEAVDGLFDSPVERYRIVTDPLPAGEHTSEVRATTMGNLNGASNIKITGQ
ncbi:MAG: hypothetical protein KY468_16225 [Armatimonadetes bacterium]|nr:hypothetical protein [Armatimonadota bacterium]